MSTPIIELIAENVKTAINAVTEANGYNQNHTAVRPKKVDYASPWNDLTALVCQVEADVIDGVQSCTSWRQYFLIVVMVVESDTATASIDTRHNQIASDIEKQIMVDHTRGGNAVDTKIVEKMPFDPDDESPGGVAVKISVDYRTPVGNPYTKG